MIKYASIENPEALKNLYQAVTTDKPGTMARRANEVTTEFFEVILDKVQKTGISVGAYDGDKLVGFIYAFKPEPKSFDHVLSTLAIGVHPDYQKQKIGSTLMEKFMKQVKASSINRVELFTPDFNTNAHKIYKEHGFVVEGVFKKRAIIGDLVIDDYAMAWVRD